MNPIMKMALLQQQANYSPYGIKTRYLSFTKAASDYAIIDGAAGEAVIDLLHGAGAITVEFYYNQQVLPADTGKRNQFVVVNGGGGLIQIDIRRDATSPNPYFLVCNARSQAGDTIRTGTSRGDYTNAINTWYKCQVEFNFTTGYINCWIDDSQVINRSAAWGSSTFVKGTSPFAITLSSPAAAAANTLDGYLDEVRVWKGTRADIKATRSGWETGLVLFNKLNDGSGSTLTDSSQYGNHGTVSGATWVTL